MQDIWELQNQTLMFGDKISQLLKKEIEDKEKLKMTNELATSKKQYILDKGAWENGRDKLKGENDEERKNLLFWRIHCLDSESKGKKKETKLTNALTSEKKARGTCKGQVL